MSSAEFFLPSMHSIKEVTYTTLWAYSADDKLMTLFLFSPENRFDI